MSDQPETANWRVDTTVRSCSICGGRCNTMFYSTGEVVHPLCLEVREDKI